MRVPSFPIALAALAALAACKPAAPAVDTAAEEAAIRAQVAVFNAALASYDDSTIVSLYAPDAVLLPPNQERLVGSEAIGNNFAGLEPLKATLVLAPTGVVIAASGDLAVEEGTWTYSMPMADGSTYNDNGKYLETWKKVNGAWLIQYDAWNSSTAPPAAPAAAPSAKP